MKTLKKLKIISIICGVIGLIMLFYGLFIIQKRIMIEKWGHLPTSFIISYITVLITIVLDFLITLDKIKKGLTYSCISSLIKIGFIIFLIPYTIDDYEYQYVLKYGRSDFNINLIFIISLVMTTIPSIINIIKLSYLRKKN